MMRKPNLVATSGGACVFLFAVMMYVRPEFFVVLLAGLGYWALLLGILVAFGFGVAEWSGETRFWMIPALICGTFAAATHWVAVPVARIIGDTEFRLRLDEYENTVRTLDEPQNEFPEGCRSAIVAPNRKLPHRIIWL